MQSRSVLAFALLVAVAAMAPGAARADWDDRPDPSEFETSLAPHGYWVDDGSFGRVWRPSVPWDWRPYSDGQWQWTSYGWTWVSYEPWAWTFHYGRWGFSNAYGWVWAPGYVWGPAWVDWYWGDGFVGWAPLGVPGFAIVPSYWTYVHDYHFCAPHVSTVVIRDQRFLPGYVVHHRDRGWGRAPGLHDIEMVSRHPIERRSDRPTDSIAPWVSHRIERGERVRERVADRNGERVIEHAGRPHEGKDAPKVVDDGGWRRPHGDDDQRRPDGYARPRQPGDGNLTHGRDDDGVTMGGRQPRDRDQGQRGGGQLYVDPRRGRGGDGDAGMAHPRQVEPSRGWTAAPRRAPEGGRQVVVPGPEPRVYQRPSAPGGDGRVMGHQGPSGGGGQGGGGGDGDRGGGGHGDGHGGGDPGARGSAP